MKKSFSEVNWWQVVVIATATGVGQIFVHEVARGFLPRYFSPAVVDWIDPMCRGFVLALGVLIATKFTKPKAL